MTPDEFVASYFDHRNGVNLKNPDQAKFLAPWIHRIRATPPQSAILPWIEAGQQAENSTYFCSVFNAAQNAELEAQIRAFLGRSHLDFVGRPIALSKTSHPDMLVADLTGGWGFKFGVPKEHRTPAREQIKLLLQTLQSQPLSLSVARRPVDQLLRDFHMALNARNRASAELSLRHLREDALLDDDNCLFLRIQMLEAIEEDEELLELESIRSICIARRPIFVTQALLKSIYRFHLSECKGAEDAIVQFKAKEIREKYSGILNQWEGITAPEARCCLALANAVSPVNWNAVQKLTVDTGETKAGLLLRSIRALLPDEQPIQPDLKTKIVTGDFEAAFVSTQQQQTSCQKCRQLFFLAQLVGTATANKVAKDEVAKLSPEDQVILQKELQNSIWPSIHTNIIAVTETTPGNWLEWFQRLNKSGEWPEAVDCAEKGQTEWSIQETLNNSAAKSLASEILKKRVLNQTEKFNRALPHFVGWLLDDEKWPNPIASEIYEAVLISLLTLENHTKDDLAVFNHVLDGVLRTTRQSKTDLIKDLVKLMADACKPQNVPWALDLLETVIPELKNPSDAGPLFVELLNWFREFPLRINKMIWILAEQISIEIKIGTEEIRRLKNLITPVQTEMRRSVSIEDLGGRSVLLYTLTPGVAERVKELILKCSPNSTVWISNDHGGTTTLHQHAKNADFALVAWSSSKHAATGVIKAERKGLKTEMVAGKGQSSFITSLLVALENSKN